MKWVDKFNKKIKVRFFNKIDKAIDEVKYGLYARINLDSAENGEDEPGLFAAAVVNELFSLPPATVDSKTYLEKNLKKVNTYIEKLKTNKEIKEVLTQAMKVRLQVVFQSIGSGGSDEFARIPLNNLQKKGLIINSLEIMDPKDFIKFAKKYIQSSPEYKI